MGRTIKTDSTLEIDHMLPPSSHTPVLLFYPLHSVIPCEAVLCPTSDLARLVGHHTPMKTITHHSPSIHTLMHNPSYYYGAQYLAPSYYSWLRRCPIPRKPRPNAD